MDRVIVRAYNAEGSHMDILVMDRQQVRMCHGRLNCRPVIVPADFPAVVRFEIIVEGQG